MTKIAYNACFGGFSLSDGAIKLIAEMKGITLYPENFELYTMYWTDPEHTNAFDDRAISRTDPHLIKVIEELGSSANGEHADLRIRKLAPGTLYIIDEYDGLESVVARDEFDWQTA